MAVGDLITGTLTQSGVPATYGYGNDSGGGHVGTLGQVGVQYVIVTVDMTDSVSGTQWTLTATGPMFYQSLFYSTDVLLTTPGTGGPVILGNDGLFVYNPLASAIGDGAQYGFFTMNDTANRLFKVPQQFLINSSGVFGFVEN